MLIPVSRLSNKVRKETHTDTKNGFYLIILELLLGEHGQFVTHDQVRMRIDDELQCSRMAWMQLGLQNESWASYENRTEPQFWNGCVSSTFRPSFCHLLTNLPTSLQARLLWQKVPSDAFALVMNDNVVLVDPFTTTSWRWGTLRNYFNTSIQSMKRMLYAHHQSQDEAASFSTFSSSRAILVFVSQKLVKTRINNYFGADDYALIQMPVVQHDSGLERLACIPLHRQFQGALLLRAVFFICVIGLWAFLLGAHLAWPSKQSNNGLELLKSTWQRRLNFQWR